MRFILNFAGCGLVASVIGAYIGADYIPMFTLHIGLLLMTNNVGVDKTK